MIAGRLINSVLMFRGICCNNAIVVAVLVGKSLAGV